MNRLLMGFLQELAQEYLDKTQVQERLYQDLIQVLELLFQLLILEAVMPF